MDGNLVDCCCNDRCLFWLWIAGLMTEVEVRSLSDVPGFQNPDMFYVLCLIMFDCSWYFARQQHTDWTKMKDPSSGYPYWYNSRTGVSSWEQPTSLNTSSTTRLRPTPTPITTSFTTTTKQQISGIPFGLMNDMLGQSKSQLWRGFVFGCVTRLPYSHIVDNQQVWKIWDDWKLNETTMSGWWRHLIYNDDNNRWLFLMHIILFYYIKWN